MKYNDTTGQAMRLVSFQQFNKYSVRRFYELHRWFVQTVDRFEDGL
jgi:hypothetical protein